MSTATAAAPEATATRVFVGGVGESVGEDDLRKIFGALGTIGGVEIVRTKGRSFAYFDFVPATQNSLNKLFSKYNGCVWKGGRIRLEKAKEHYLFRLKREWEEDAEQNIAPSDALDAEKDPAAPVKAKNFLDKEKHLHIFFPRLKKVKSLPFRGTGKHKYSFQKVEVPPLPKHFCDCEEHSDLPHSSELKKSHKLDSQGDGSVNAKELDMMNLVMNKLFQREADSITARSGNEPIKDEKISSAGFLEPQLEEDMVDHDEDDDNLVINMITGVGDGITGGHIDNFSMNQESKSHKRQTFGDELARNRLSIHKRDSALPNKENKSLSHGHGAGKESFSSPNEQNDNLPVDSEVSRKSQKLQPVVFESRTQNLKKHPSWSQKSSWKELLGERNEFAFSVSHVLPGGGTPGDEQLLSDNLNVLNNVDCKIQHGDDEHEHAEDKTNRSAKLEDTTESESAIQNKSSAKTGRGSSWLHKSSWTQLVTDNKSKSFSISLINPALNSEHELPADDIAESKQQDESIQDGSNGLRGEMEEPSSAAFDSSMASQVVERNLSQQEGPDGALNFNLLTVQKSNKVAAASLTEERRISVPNQSVLRVDRECPFMRSEASLRDWANSKVALTKSLKRKR
ncbi:RRM domain-containing protein [Psidium guajava]|nr:RRM domain-containing protein [Psidium guajava]